MKTPAQYTQDAIRLSTLPRRLSAYGVPFSEQRALLIEHWKSIAEKAAELAIADALSENYLPALTELTEADITSPETEEEYDSHPDFLGREHGRY